MFPFSKYANYRICFKKKYHDYGWGKWHEMKDIYYISRLTSLQNKYQFKITSIKMKDSITFDKSVIYIRCKKYEHVLIFSDFVKLCNGEVVEVSY